MKFGCTGNYQKPEFFKIATEIYYHLKNTEHDYYLSSSALTNGEHPELKEVEVKHIQDIAEECDVILSIGGDGTILATLRQIGKSTTPILGIHIGGLGFLAACSQKDYIDSINEIINGNYFVEKRMLIEATIDTNKSRKFFALNDIVIDHGTSARILKTHVYVSDKYLNTFESDGMIFATPTGSTAYSLSAGGPIITPSLDVILVTPICPHSLSARSIALSSEEVISVSFAEEPAGMAVTIDGQVRLPVDYSTKISIRKADYSANMIQFVHNDYFQTLRTKMGWAGNVR
ncbi:MAG: NAD(+)/NADH kinase [Candidatus Marinimicrobia bacterium]|nr:NAD(+)/NADH kinase [Candidatus Neomarinimicrobiota bacterium]MBL7023345.1 NAD(+)/NADH kinase [Candidatus Neomarinimicrobiota bacterium]MBL7109304.1 NAD(+)/NADH kinase [Candidatus Neomarinimicrobiota bacterium]